MHRLLIAIAALAGLPTPQLDRAVLVAGPMLLVATGSGCRGMLPAQRAGVSTPAPAAAAAPALGRGTVTVYIVASAQQASLLQGHVNEENDGHGRHDVVYVVGPTQALIVNAAVLRGGLPNMRVIDLEPHAGSPSQPGGNGAVVLPNGSP